MKKNKVSITDNFEDFEPLLLVLNENQMTLLDKLYKTGLLKYKMFDEEFEDISEAKK